MTEQQPTASSMSIQFSATHNKLLANVPRRQVSATKPSSHQPPHNSRAIRKISPFTLKIHCESKCTDDVLQTSSVHLPISTACIDILKSYGCQYTFSCYCFDIACIWQTAERLLHADSVQYVAWAAGIDTLHCSMYLHNGSSPS